MREEKKSIRVNIQHLEEAFGIELHEFHQGGTYPLSKLFESLGHLPRFAQVKLPDIEGGR